jgi:hypothetical protein
MQAKGQILTDNPEKVYLFNPVALAASMWTITAKRGGATAQYAIGE